MIPLGRLWFRFCKVILQFLPIIASVLPCIFVSRLPCIFIVSIPSYIFRHANFDACEVELSTVNYPWESFSSFYSISAVWSRFVEEREVCLRIQIASPSEEIPAHVLSRFVEERSCMGSCVTLYDCYPFFFTHSLICIGCVFYHH